MTSRRMEQLNRKWRIAEGVRNGCSDEEIATAEGMKPRSVSTSRYRQGIFRGPQSNGNPNHDPP